VTIDKNDTSSQPDALPDATRQVDALLERLEGLLGAADAGDLQGLADLHTILCDACKLADSALDADRAGTFHNTASAGMQLVESIVLKEVDDFHRSIGQLGKTVADLRGFLAGKSLDITSSAAGASGAGASHAPIVAPQAPLSEADLPLVQEFIGEATGHIEAAEAGLLQLEEDVTNADAINAVFRSFHTIKGVAGFLNLSQIGALAHAAENVLDLCRKGKMQFDSGIADIILHSVDAMRKLIEILAAIATTGGTPAPLDGLEDLLHRLHDCAEGRRAATSAPQKDSSISSPAAETSAPKADSKSESRSAHCVGDSTIKVSTERLDSLINTVGELVIAQAMVTQDMITLAAQDRRVSRNVSHLGKIARELQELSMSMRMVPIQGVFQKMSRLVRDLARKANKEIDFIVTGGETELDRNVVEAISDPLVHMVRNAADHGIEMPEDRAKAGKPRAGKLTLKAFHRAGNIVIEITDDGKGLNKAKIVKKATDAGLIKPGQELSEQEIFRLIFAPGLSTAEKVTDVSGRGVGMDVVRRNVEALRGQIDIASVEGQGSTFSIRLPLTLAVIDGLVLKVGKERYIIPITSIEQSLQPRAEQISTVQGRSEMCMVRDDLLPILRLHRLFGVAGAKEDVTQGLLVIVHSGPARCCVLVDELLGQQQVVIKSLGAGLGQVKGISGGAILGDGNVSLILDVPGLIWAAGSAASTTHVSAGPTSNA
jgi:two-component system chemotaxis sensor kinase CheA